jgi:hypothetical protein
MQRDTPRATALAPRSSTSSAAGYQLGTTTKYQLGASGIGMGISIKKLRCKMSAAAGNGLGITIKYLRPTTSATAGNGLGTRIS